MTGWERAAFAAPLAWDPESGGKLGPICFEDDKTYDLGEDLTGNRFSQIAHRMRSGDYYPLDAVRFEGRFRKEGRLLRKGDRVFQYAPVLLSLGGPLLRSAVEIFVSEQSENEAILGYVTTAMHHGRGIWQATLRRDRDRLSLRVKSTACPNSWLFWLGLPFARFCQLRARRRGVEWVSRP